MHANDPRSKGEGARAILGTIAAALIVVFFCAPTSRADELDRQWLQGRIDQAPASMVSVEPIPPDIGGRLALLGWNGPPASATVELHRRLGEVETLDRLWSSKAREPTLTVRLDDDGRFRLRTPDGGPWRVIARAPGFLAMEIVPPSVPDVVELGTVWMVSAVQIDLAPHLQPLLSAATSSEPAGPARVWLASSEAPYIALELQRPLHDWRPLPLRSWWRPGSSIPVPRGGKRVLWALPEPSPSRPYGRDQDPDTRPDGAGTLVADGATRAMMPTLLVADSEGSADMHAGSSARSPVTIELTIVRFDASPRERPCQGVLGERPIGPVRSGARLDALVGDRLRVVCPEGSGQATISGASIAGGVPVEVVVAAPRLPTIRWRLEGSGQTVDRVALVTGVGDAVDPPLGPPHAAIGAVTRDPSIGWVEVRASGIAGGRVPAAELVASAHADAAPVAAATEGPVVEGWLRRPSLIEGWVRGDFGDGMPGIDIVALDAGWLAEPEPGSAPGTAPGAAPRAVWGRSDEQGRFRLRDVPPGRSLLLATVSREHSPLVVQERSPGAGARRQDVVLDLARPLDLVGWVVDGAGSPILGAEVTLRRFASVGRLQVVDQVLRGPHFPAHERRLATTDDQGRFVFSDAERRRLSLDVAASGFASAFVSGVEPQRTDARVREERLEIELGTFELAPERRVELRVVDRDGNPVPGALVSWTSSLLPASTPLRFASRSPYRENPMQPIWHNVDADDRGEATLRGIEQQATVTVLVEAPGFVPHRVDELVLEWGAEGDFTQTGPVEVMLTPEARIAGRVERTDGSPLQGAYVALHATDIAADLGSPSLRTGVEGRFAFDRLPPGDLRITVNAVDEAAIDPLDVTLEVGQQVEGLVLRAPPSARVEGRVMENGAPLEDVSVVCCGDLAHTDAAGVFAIERARLGPHALEVRLRGREDHVTQIEVGASGNWFEIDIHAPDLDRPRRTLRGRLRAPSEIEERLLDGPAVGMELRSRSTGDAEPVLLEGLAFHVVDVPAGRYVLTVAAPGTRIASVPVDLRERDVTDLVIELEPESDLTLRVTVENVDVRSTEGWFRFGLPLLLRGESGMVMNRSARWQSDHEYLLERMAAGRWTVQAETVDGRRRASADVEIRADGGEALVVLVFEESERERITGTLRVDGTPASGWIMVRTSEAGSSAGASTRFGGVIEHDGPGDRPELTMPTASARSNSLGQFEFAASPGPARLLVSTGSGALGWFDVDLRPGVPLTLDLARRTIAGRVEDSAGAPIAGTTVIARDAGGGSYRGRATSNAAGDFEVQMLTDQGAFPALEVALEGTINPAAWTPVLADSVVVRSTGG